MRSARFFLSLFCMAVLSGVALSNAQDLGSRPARASEAVSALQSSQWQQLSNEMELMQVSSALGTRLTAIKIPIEKFKFSVVQQTGSKGERASAALERLDADLVVNGGFFRANEAGDLFPVGLLVDDGVRIGTPWTSVGGFVAIDQDGLPTISLSSEALGSGTQEAIQSRPVLIEKGGQWAMRTNGTELERRTLVCQLADKDIIILIVGGSGLTLFEAGWLFRNQHWGGFFGCDSAIALDGGGSTQLAVKERSDLAISGLTRVQNLLVVSKR